jgi:hypothetical protein
VNVLYQNAENLLGSFCLVKCKYDNDNLYLIDGQHRREAIRRKLSENTKKNFNIHVDVKEVLSENDIINYFKNINNVKPMDNMNIPSLKYKNLIDMLCTEFPNIFISDLSKKKKPYIRKKDFLNFLKNHDIFNCYDCDEIFLFNEIIKKNSHYSIDNNLLKNTPKEILDIAKYTGFYLTCFDLNQNTRWINDIKLNLTRKEKIIKIKIKKEI